MSTMPPNRPLLRALSALCSTLHSYRRIGTMPLHCSLLLAPCVVPITPLSLALSLALHCPLPTSRCKLTLESCFSRLGCLALFLALQSPSSAYFYSASCTSRLCVLHSPLRSKSTLHPLTPQCTLRGARHDCALPSRRPLRTPPSTSHSRSPHCVVFITPLCAPLLRRWIFVVPTVLIALDFVWTTSWHRHHGVDHAHYVVQFLWVCAPLCPPALPSALPRPPQPSLACVGFRLGAPA